MNPYTQWELNQKPVFITRIVTDDDDKVLASDKIQCETLGEAVEIIRQLFECDRMMYECLKTKTGNALVATRDECVDNKYSYTMYVRKRAGSRRVTAGIDNISRHAAKMFCLDADSIVTEQEE